MRVMSLLAAALVLATATTAARQQPSVADPSQPVAFVVRYADGRVVRRTIGPTFRSWTPMFPRVPGWAAPDGSVPVSAIRYVATRSDAGLAVVVSVLRGQQHQQELEIARVVLTGPDPVRVAGLGAVGVRPVELWVEPGDRKRVFPPAVDNRTAGLDVTSLEIEDGPPAILVATVRNLSAKPVVTYNVEVLGSDRRLLLAAWQALASGLPVIAPGGAHTFRMNVANGPPPELLVIAGVQWSDGTFEGDARAAATQWCRDAGARVQVARIMTMLRASAADGPAALAALEAQATALDVVASPAMQADVASRMVDPAPMTEAEVAHAIAFHLQRLKRELLEELTRVRALAVDAGATRTWFAAAIAAYQDRLTELAAR